MKRTLLLLALVACGGTSQSAGIAISPQSVSLTSNGTQQFAALVTGNSDTAVVWSVDEALAGSITADGLYTAPQVTSSSTFHVRAVAHADPSVSIAAAVTVAPATAAPVISSFTASPASIAVGASSTLAFAVTGAQTMTISPGVGAVTGNSFPVSPAATTTYTLTASNSAGSTAAQVTVTVHAATNGLPLISTFTANPTSIAAGQSSTLSFAVSGATSMSISGVGTVTGTSVSVSPTATTTYVLTATNGAGSVTASAQVTLVAVDVTFTANSSQSAHAISTFVYGYNDRDDLPSGTTFIRSGGNRLTAYNWETNASNAGKDFIYENDDFLSSSKVPGAAIWPTMDKNIPALITLPMQGWVSANENVALNGPPFPAQSQNFFPSLPKKPSAFASPPSLTDNAVYQDEFAAAVAAKYPGRQLFFSLDNEPDLWSDTHAEIQASPLTYASILSLSTALSSAVKDAVPSAQIFGPVNYGFTGYFSLQGAPDAPKTITDSTWFLDFYLKGMKTASDNKGVRLLDVLDVHWYPEAMSGANFSSGVNVCDSNPPAATRNAAAVQAARVQAPRSYWDATYLENSFIGQFFAPVAIVRKLLGKIAADYPGTKLSFSEYNPGGSDDISGAVAEADTLGIFGREGVYAATYWPLLDDNRFVLGAYRSFRNFDGAGAAFGDTSFSATASNDAKASIYASHDAANPARVVVVAINKTTAPLVVKLNLTDSHTFTKAHAWQLTASSTFTSPSIIPGAVADVAVSGNAFQTTLPAYSVTTYAFVP